MKIRYLSTLLLSLFVFVSCSDKKKISSEAHQQAVELTSSMEALHKSLNIQLSELEEENTRITANVRRMEEPDGGVMEMIKKHNSLITQITGQLKSQEELIKQHQAYIKKHETTALSPSEIKAQHIQMNKDFDSLKKEVIQISDQIEEMQRQYKGVLSQLNETQ